LLSIVWLTLVVLALVAKNRIAWVSTTWALSMLFGDWIILPGGLTVFLPACLLLGLTLWRAPHKPSTELRGGPILLLFTACTAMAVGVAIVRGTSFGASFILLYVVMPLFIGDAARRLKPDESTLRSIRLGLTIAFCVEAALLLLQHATDSFGLLNGVGRVEDTVALYEPRGYLGLLLPQLFDPSVIRARGSLPTGNYAAQFMDFAAPIALAGWIGGKARAARWGWSAAIGLLLAGIYVTYSRGSILGFAIAGLVILYGIHVGQSAVRRGIGALSVIAAGIALIAVARYVLSFWVVDSTGGSVVFDDRLAIVIATAAVLMQSTTTILFGLGTRGYQELTTVSTLEELRGRTEIFGHNGLIVHAAEYGMIAAAVLVVLFASWCRSVWKICKTTTDTFRRQYALGLIGSITSMVTHQMVDHAWGDHHFKAIAFFILGLGWSLTGGEPGAVRE
jgi:hypothetical protein